MEMGGMFIRSFLLYQLKLINLSFSSGQQVLSMPSSKSLVFSFYKNVRFTFTCFYYIIYITEVEKSAFAPVLLEKKAQKIRKTVDIEKGPYKSVRTVFDTDDRS